MPDFSSAPLKTGNDFFQFNVESNRVDTDRSYDLSGLALTDASLHRFIDILENVYVSTWYNKFSSNAQVPRKIRHILCFMVKKVSRQLQKIDFQKLVFEDGKCFTHWKMRGNFV